MILPIYPDTSISDVQSFFHRAYPFLRIAFCDGAHAWGERCATFHWHDPTILLTHVAERSKIPASIPLHPWLKTGDVEDAFETCFGLHAQIFRKEGGRWVETAGTDDLTLDEQNDIGYRSEARLHEVMWIEREVIF